MPSMEIAEKFGDIFFEEGRGWRITFATLGRSSVGI